MNLTDELTRKQAPKFQINSLSTAFLNGRVGLLENSFVDEVLKNNSEGIFNLNPDFFANGRLIKSFMNYLNAYKFTSNYEFELNETVTNYEVMFKKKELKK